MKALKFPLLVIPAVLLVSGLAGKGAFAQVNTHAWAKQATFIFEGEPLKPGSTRSQDRSLPAGNIVRVLTILYVSSNVSVRPGDLIVMEAATTEPLDSIKRAVFYTTGWVYGARLAVHELGHAPPQGTVEQLKQEIAAAKAEAEDDRIRERLAGAEIVLVGKVLTSRAYGAYREISHISEHDPDWWLAEVSAEKILKGPPERRVVLVAFPKSTDVMWGNSPKFTPGEEGLWILALPRNLAPIFSNVGQPVYSAISPRDFHPLKDVDRITKLLTAPN